MGVSQPKVLVTVTLSSPTTLPSTSRARKSRTFSPADRETSTRHRVVLVQVIVVGSPEIRIMSMSTQPVPLIRAETSSSVKSLPPLVVMEKVTREGTWRARFARRPFMKFRTGDELPTPSGPTTAELRSRNLVTISAVVQCPGLPPRPLSISLRMPMYLRRYLGRAMIREKVLSLSG